ncbi:MAG: DUF5074 domain-containing protein [Flavobacteriales bacterium]|jgi:hypothetical protein
MNRVVIIFSLCALFFSSCKKEDASETTVTADPSGMGAYVSNEGSFMNNNASVSYIAQNGSVLSDPYFDANNFPMGDVLQSIAFQGNRGFAVLNNSQRVTIFDRITFEHIGEIEGCDYPRHMLPLSSSKAYLTNGSMSGQVLIVDLNTLSISGSVNVGNGPERMTRSGDVVFVANSGGWLSDNTVSIINATNDAFLNSVTVGDRPIDMVTDATSDVWVLCAGVVLYDENWNITGHTAASLYRLAQDGTVEWSALIGNEGDHPDDLAVSPDGQTVYYNNNGIHSLSISAPDEPHSVMLSGAFHSLDVNPETGDLWLTSIPDFVTQSTVYRYSSGGALISSWQTGIGANGVWWR